MPTSSHQPTIISLLLLAHVFIISHGEASDLTQYTRDDQVDEADLKAKTTTDGQETIKCPFEQLDQDRAQFRQSTREQDQKWSFVKSPVKVPEVDSVSEQIISILHKLEEDSENSHEENSSTSSSSSSSSSPGGDRHAGKEQVLEKGDQRLYNWRAFINYFPSGRDLISKRLNLMEQFHLEPTTSTTAPPSTVGSDAIMKDKEIAINLAGREQSSGELDQQQEVSKYRQPIFMYTMDDESLKMMLINQIPVSRPPGSIGEIKEQSSNSSLQQFEDSFGEATAERARNSLLKAAEVAKHLAESTTIKPASTIETRTLVNTTANLSDWTVMSDGEISLRRARGNMTAFSSSLEGASPSNDTKKLAAKFLGFGELQRIEPFNGNDRTQARLSCQFGFGDNILPKNMTISGVEWVKFTGKYNYDLLDNNSTVFSSKKEGTPLFEQCSMAALTGNLCEMTKIKNDIFTTVHPRPAIQNYIHTMAPSYSITIHEVNENHYGLYRCSAIRKETSLNGTMELVFRLIPFE